MKHKPTSISSAARTRILSTCFVLASGTLALAQSDTLSDWERHNVCSERTLYGDYGAKIEGTLLDFPGRPLLRNLTLFHFKGDGTMTSKAFAVLNGNPEQPDWPEEGNPGSYKIRSDCTGSVDVVSPPITFHLVVVDHGRKFFIVLDRGAISGVAEKVH